ncbi:CUT domain protein [Trichuris suis]|nr:CUT domain protein [Trichuris suis]
MGMKQQQQLATAAAAHQFPSSDDWREEDRERFCFPIRLPEKGHPHFCHCVSASARLFHHRSITGKPRPFDQRVKEKKGKKFACQPKSSSQYTFARPSAHIAEKGRSLHAYLKRPRCGLCQTVARENQRATVSRWSPSGRAMESQRSEFMESLITDIHSGMTTGADSCNGSGSDPMLSAADLGDARSPVSGSALSSLVDATEYRSHLGANDSSSYHTLNGRMSPSSVSVLSSVAPIGFASVTYATLTPLQPLPPISTVTQSDKFAASNAAAQGGFGFVAQPTMNSFVNSCVPNPNAGQPNTYNMSMKYESPKRADQVTKVQYDAGAGFDFDNATTTTLLGSTNGANGQALHGTHHSMSPMVPTTVNMAGSQAGVRAASNGPSSVAEVSNGRAPKGKSVATPGCGPASHHQHHGSASNGSASDLEEINTKELAQRISAELKRYSIPQAIFAQRVLCRSQGTLSDLLRNPKPWSKLKSGRETFRRMLKWLQEPEFQRMSALRLAGKGKAIPFYFSLFSP